MRRYIYLFTTVLVFGLQSLMVNGFSQSNPERDSVMLRNDSLLRIIEVKDSLLLQASLDSLALNNLMEVLWWEKDSIQGNLQNLRYQLHQDSIYEAKRDSMFQEWNRENRWSLRDSVSDIDEDSVKSRLLSVMEKVYSDDSRIPSNLNLREDWNQLLYHLKNDSTYFTVHFADDSIQLVMKDGRVFTEAIFLTNTMQDSAKVFAKVKDQRNVSMWIDDGLFLTSLLKRKDIPDSLEVNFKELTGMKITRKKMPLAPPKYWSTDGKMIFQLNQVANKNWVKGGDNRFTFLLDAKGLAKYAKGKMTWTSDYWYRYGLLKSQDQQLFKNVDALRLKSNFLHRAFKQFDYSALGQFDTGLFPGYRSPIDTVPVSKFMSAAYLNIGVGMKYNTKKKDISVNLSPVSGKFTFVLDTVTINAQRFKIEEGKRVKGEFGATLNVNYKKTIWKNILLDTKLGLFSNYMKNPEKIDVDWTTQFSLKVNKYVSTRLFFHLIYDYDIQIPFYETVDGVEKEAGKGPAVQLQETFGITFTYHL